MAEVAFSPQARRDLRSILERLDKVAGPVTARKYDTAFKRVIMNLERFPGSGSPRAHLGKRTRMTSVPPYLIFYDGGPRSRVVDVLRIVDGRRDITPELIARGRER